VSERKLYRYTVTAEELGFDGRSFGVCDREVWAASKKDAAKRHPHLPWGRIRILRVRQVGGKRTEVDT
jgi:hypothetical protein